LEARIKTGRQFIFAVIDGAGWLRRQSDLRRIHDLREGDSIDGLYTISQLGEFRFDLESAAKRLGLL
jgi:hypothetical protein